MGRVPPAQGGSSNLENPLPLTMIMPL
jgi:hypothetical protein